MNTVLSIVNKKEVHMGVIYKLTNNLNGKIYVGQTTDLKRRMKEYRFKSRHIEGRSKYNIMKQIHDVGFDNFSVDVLEECDDSELNDKEIYWISKLNSRNPDVGYNSKTGGKGGTLTEYSKHLMSESSKSFRHTEDEKLRRSKPIFVVNGDKIIPNVSAKRYADQINRSRAEVTHAILRGIKINNHYVFYQDRALRKEVLHKLSSKHNFYSSDYYLTYMKFFNNESVETNY